MAEISSDTPNHQRLYLLAEQQAGYFSASQARRAGFSRSLVSYHVGTGRFVRVRPRVYRLAQFPAFPHEDLHIAWLEVGPEAAISHDSALALYELSDLLPAQVHLTVSRTASRRRQGIRLHTKRLSPEEITRYGGLPVTTIPRTLVDVTAGGLADEQVRLAIQQAIQRGMVTREALMALTVQHGGRIKQIIIEALKEEGAE